MKTMTTIALAFGLAALRQLDAQERIRAVGVPVSFSDGLRKSVRTRVHSKVHGKRYSSGNFRLHDEAACHCAIKYRRNLDHLC
jgi:hypothetical protein